MQKTLTSFSNDEYEYSDIKYKDPRWDLIRNRIIFYIEDTTVNGANNPTYKAGYLALDEHFNGKESQDYQTTYVVTIDGD